MARFRYDGFLSLTPVDIFFLLQTCGCKGEAALTEAFHHVKLLGKRQRCKSPAHPALALFDPT